MTFHEQVWPEEIKSVSINDKELTIERILAVSRFNAVVEPFSGPNRKRVTEVRKYVEAHWLGDDAAPRYGFNTGVGTLKNVRISKENIERFQKLYIKSHSVGVGEPLDIEIVRAAMLLQAKALSKGYSGVRPLIIDKLVEMLNKCVHPVVPEQGSLGASGDLAPLTHIASVLVGENEARIWVDQKQVQLAELKNASGELVFRTEHGEVQFRPVALQGKEAVSLTNSTAGMQAIAVHVLHDVGLILKNADIAAALSLEAMMCETAAFDERLHDLRNQAGQITTAQNIRNLIHGSKRMTREARFTYFQYLLEKNVQEDPKGTISADGIAFIKRYKVEHEFEKNRIQDAYSLRCIPQVHGACKDTFNYVKSIIGREIVAVTDNPVIFADQDQGGFQAVSGGNFHGEPIALALDFLAIALAEIGNISERRLFRLLNPGMSFGLPRNLSGGQVGLNSGLMLAQYTAAQLASENKGLAHPATVDSIPTSDNQEDHVSMGFTAARKLCRVVRNVQTIVAIEYICATQALHLSSEHSSLSVGKMPLGKGSSLVFDFISKYEDASLQTPRPFKKMEEDEYLHTKISVMRELSAQGAILKAVDKQIELLI